MNAARSEAYVYTASNRLQQGEGIWGTLNWSYDGVGNRTSEALTSGYSNTYNYATGNNLLASLTQSATTIRSFSYDGAGNLITDSHGGTTYHYIYNKRNRLAELDIGSTVTADYTYDGLERLAIRTTQNMTPSGTTQYAYDLQGHLLAESDGSGNTLTEYVWFDDMPLALVANVDTSPSLYYVHVDHLDRPIMMTDASKAVVWQADYNPFGQIYSITGSATNNLRFPGQYFLVESGLDYNWYRHYDETLGRYTQPDPLRNVTTGSAATNVNFSTLTSLPTSNASVNWQAGEAASLPIAAASDIATELPEFNSGASIFGYARENPLSFTDRSGLQASAVCVLGGPANPACDAGILMDVAKVCIAVAIAMSHRTDTDDKDHCEKLLKIDTDTCNAITRRRGARAGAVCHASASERYAACLRGKPLPPLNTWNN